MKRVWFGIGLGVILLGGGWLAYRTFHSSDDSLATTSKAQESELGVSVPRASLGEAIDQGGRLECTYTDPTRNGRPGRLVVQEDKFLDSIWDNGIAYTFSDGQMIYAWSEKAFGRKYAKTCRAALPENERAKIEDPLTTLGAMRDVLCKTMGPEDLQVPDNVTFFDQCEDLRSTPELVIAD